MKKVFGGWVILSAIIMLVLPWLTVSFVRSDAAMAICFLLFFGVNPIYSVIVGVFAGRNAKQLWSLPVISAVLFLIGTWMFFDMGEPAFVMYAGIYLAVGIVVMLISMYITTKMQG